MHKNEELSSLIGDVDDAAIDPSPWQAVLAKTRDFVGGSSAALFSKDATRKSLNVFYEDGALDPHYRQLYFEKYVKLDPFTTGHVFAEIEQPISTVDLLPYEEFQETRFCKEWARPQGLVDFVCAALDKSATSTAMFGVFRHERHGLVDEETRRRMRLIVPHIRRAVLISRTIDLKSAEAATFADTLMALPPACSSSTSQIVHANASGYAMRESSVLRAAGGRPQPSRRARGNGAGRDLPHRRCGDTAVGTRGIAIPLRARDGGQYVHVLPLTSGGGALRRAAPPSPRCSCTAEMEAPSLPRRSPGYNLTPSEPRVLLAIVRVGGVPETAGALGVAEATVKTHLHRLFGKTGASRQADLVKLVAGFASPLMSARRLVADNDHSIDGRAMLGAAAS
jgi:DNA-binding CsgD family transcriptional regulator